MKNGWKTVPLEGLAVQQKGGIKIGPFGSQLKKQDLVSSGIHVVGIENVLNETFDGLGERFISPEKFQTLRTVQILPGDLLITMMGTIGKVAIVPNGIRTSIMDSHLLRVRPDRKLCRIDYLAWAVFGSPAVQQSMQAQAHGAIMRGLNSAIVRSLPIMLPPLTEQNRIVGILDETFAGIAMAKANAEKNLQNARALFASHLQSVFTQRGNGWAEKTLGESCENLDSKRVPITRNKRTAGKYPYYGASGIVDHVSDYIFDEDLLLVSEDGANLLARTYPIAFSVSGKVWVNNHAHVLRFADLATQRFMELYLNLIKLNSYVSGMAQPKLNQNSLNSIPVPVPPLPQRKAIVQKLEALSKETQRLESIYQRKLIALEALKKSLLHQAFDGEL
jgi:type I restriction enzyme S subunit